MIENIEEFFKTQMNNNNIILHHDTTIEDTSQKFNL